ncbi:DEAD/DEAH box helicase [seawater metagenome]|uniref:RNA helicase n=1 Tax=seawater metagenome TaxID=1561972 RepID=A0A5E8CI68_9ZZZZ
MSSSQVKKNNQDFELKEIKGFEDLNLSDDLLKGVYAYGFEKPSEIQKKGIQAIQSGRDCIVQAQSGTGKTATFLLGGLSIIDTSKKCCQVLVACPTRELATQIYNVLDNISKYTGITKTFCIGGTSMNKSLSDIKKGAQIIIGTPGRIYHMIEDNHLDLEHLKAMVMDEADDMLSLGFTEKIYDILKSLPEEVQVCLLSATMPRQVFDVTKNFMRNPFKILLKKDQLTLEGIKQFYIDTEVEEFKFDILLDLYSIINASQAIIYCNTIRKVDWLAKNLLEKDFPIAYIHGKLSQEERNGVVKDFRMGKTRLLLTTDLLARGIDIQQVSLVINYDLPSNKDNYIHRIGRSGRFGRKGVAINLVKMSDEGEMRLFTGIKRYFHTEIEEMPEEISMYLV